jgi:YidC/Oxa1 family membrane protein insertase
MFDHNNIFNTVLIIPILNILMALYHGLLQIKVPGALGFSLILLTVLIRLILHPLTAKQLKSTQKLAKLKPKLDEINKIQELLNNGGVEKEINITDQPSIQ